MTGRSSVDADGVTGREDAGDVAEDEATEMDGAGTSCGHGAPSGLASSRSRRGAWRLT
jgi:hypothetical protein